LNEKQRAEWSAAASFISTRGELSILSRKVAGIFSEIAEAQLKKLHERFRDKDGSKILRSIPRDWEKDVLVRFLEGRNLTLCEMINEINSARHTSQSHTPCGEFSAWMSNHAPRVLRRWNQRRATRLNELRLVASHWSRPLTEDEVVELYDLSVGMISLLASD